MDDEDFSSIHLESLSEIFEAYYQMLKTYMESAASDARKRNGYDGTISEEAANHLFAFADRTQITTFSQSLIELLTLLELQNEKKGTEVDEFAIYNSLLRLEKAASKTSSWEICGNEDDEGRLITISSFEMNMLEQNMSIYIEGILRENNTVILFFPLSDLRQSNVIVKWRIFEKISSIKITPQQTIYKVKLAEYVKRRVQNEVIKWIDVEFKKLKLSGKTTALKDVEQLNKILKELTKHVNAAKDILSVEGSLFQEISCCYFDCISQALDEKLYPLCVQLMGSMDEYQECHKSFHVNLRDSCALSYGFYKALRKLAMCLSERKTSPEISKLEDCNNLFVKFFLNLLQVMKYECHGRIKRAVQVEAKDSVHIEERILSSSVIVLNCFCTVIDEWKRIEIEDEDLNVAFLIKITDIVCDGAKIYSEALDHRLNEEHKHSKESNFIKKVSVLSNSIQHVLQYLKNIPKQMQWEDSLKRLSEDSLDISFRIQISRILTQLHRSMNSHLNSIIDKMMQTAVTSFINQCEKLLLTWIEGSNMNQAFDKFMGSFNEYLEPMQESLKEELFPKFVSHLWSSLMLFIQNNFQDGLQPEYSKILKENVQSLMDYFLHMKMEYSDAHNSILQQILSLLDLNSKTTVELQLDYYAHIAECIVSPVEYLGHIAFQAGYKTSGEVIDLYINVQKGQRLPSRKFEMDELYVKLELCPSSMFPNQVPLKSVSVTNDVENPVFNQFFQFSNLPSSSLDVKGAVIQVLVLNQDKSYSAEAVLLLNQVQNMSGFASLEFLPVYLMPLKKFDMSQIAYQVLESRSRWDKSAKLFINSRNKLAKRDKNFFSCIPGKNMCLF